MDVLSTKSQFTELSCFINLRIRRKEESCFLPCFSRSSGEYRMLGTQKVAAKILNEFFLRVGLIVSGLNVNSSSRAPLDSPLQDYYNYNFLLICLRLRSFTWWFFFRFSKVQWNKTPFTPILPARNLEFFVLWRCCVQNVPMGGRTP